MDFSELASTLDSVREGLSGLNVSGMSQDAQNALNSIISGEAWNAVTASWDDFKTSVLLWVVVGVVALVLVLTLFDGLRSAIKGLDVSALGALFVWLSVKIPDFALVQDLKEPTLVIGAVLIVLGVVIFVVTKISRARRRRR